MRPLLIRIHHWYLYKARLLWFLVPVFLRWAYQVTNSYPTRAPRPSSSFLRGPEFETITPRASYLTFQFPIHRPGWGLSPFLASHLSLFCSPATCTFSFDSNKSYGPSPVRSRLFLIRNWDSRGYEYRPKSLTPCSNEGNSSHLWILQLRWFSGGPPPTSRGTCSLWLTECGEERSSSPSDGFLSVRSKYFSLRFWGPNFG